MSVPFPAPEGPVTTTTGGRLAVASVSPFLSGRATADGTEDREGLESLDRRSDRGVRHPRRLRPTGKTTGFAEVAANG